MKRLYLLLGLLVLVIVAARFKSSIRKIIPPVAGELMNHRTVAQRLQQYGSAARGRMKRDFAEAKVSYPPHQVVLVGLKAEHELQLYAAGDEASERFIRSYSILAASGMPGPKLREGDLQVPEGIYPIELLNPNSLYHLSLRLGYPNAFDRAQAEQEGRTNLGGDIMIHGGSASIGCLAVGDEAAEDLFVLAADAGLENLTVILAPVDFRAGKSVPKVAKLPPWTDSLYQEIKTRLAELPLAKPDGR